jgi:hypothetical protein
LTKGGIIAFFLIISFLPVSAQKVSNDSIPPEQLHSPKKASIYSAILPGLGQAYNKKYWKIPVIYAGFGAFVYFADWNNGWYVVFKDAYRDLSVREGFDSEVFIKKYSKIPILATIDYTNSVDKKNTLDYLTKAQDYYRRNRDLLIISTAAFYALNIIDASVDAHLFYFDISDNLTLNWHPAVNLLENQRFLCLNCSLSF